jgi:beta-lactamase class A
MKTYLRFALLPLALCCAACASFPGERFLNPAVRHVRRLPMPPARKKVEELVNARIGAGYAKQVAVYFHSLHTGYWFGIDEKADFIPASLLKVYLLVRVLLEEERAPGTLKTVLRLQEDNRAAAPEVIPFTRLLTGQDYTVEHLVSNMIIYSDNAAAYTLYSRFADAQLEKVYSDFGIPTGGGNDDHISLKQYMMILLALYNGTYLSAEMSGKALEYLSRSEFKDGLAAGLPKDIFIAHKFGERSVAAPGGDLRQLHDCGIIYYEDYPYLLGVMTRGGDIKKLEAVISDISALVYSEVDSRSKNAKR